MPSKKNSSAGGKSVEELRIQRALDSAPVPTRINMPEVKAPSLDKLEVKVPPAPDVTKEEVQRRLHEIARMHGQVRDREMGEPLAMGDQVFLDVIGYSDKKLIPFSVQSGV